MIQAGGTFLGFKSKMKINQNFTNSQEQLMSLGNDKQTKNFSELSKQLSGQNYEVNKTMQFQPRLPNDMDKTIINLNINENQQKELLDVVRNRDTQADKSSEGKTARLRSTSIRSIKRHQDLLIEH